MADGSTQRSLIWLDAWLDAQSSHDTKWAPLISDGSWHAHALALVAQGMPWSIEHAIGVLEQNEDPGQWDVLRRLA